MWWCKTAEPAELPTRTRNLERNLDGTNGTDSPEYLVPLWFRCKFRSKSLNLKSSSVSSIKTTPRESHLIHWLKTKRFLARQVARPAKELA